jgi:hypothetical protein
MAKTKLEKELTYFFERYERDIEVIARREFERVIRPWLIKMGYSMLVGNGTYVIWNPLEKSDPRAHAPNVDIDKLPTPILNVLRAEVEHRGNGDLGCWMPDFNYLQYLRKKGDRVSGVGKAG